MARAVYDAVVSSDVSKGDPIGRRLARRRAWLLAEAGRLSSLLEVMLRRADMDTQVDAKSLTRQITNAEQSELLRSYGRIEPRRRFRQRSGRGNPIRDQRPQWSLFIDEAGTSQRVFRSEDSWFALGAIAMTGEQLEDYRQRADAIKRIFYTNPAGITFHEPLIRRGDDAFAFAGDEQKQRDLNDAVNGLIAESSFVAFGVGIRKRSIEELQQSDVRDPYLPVDIYGLALHLLLERFLDFLADQEDHPVGSVVIEAQGPKEDAHHQLTVVETILHGTQWVPERAFQQYLHPGVTFLPKHGSHPLELSDMLARDIFEWIRADCQIAPARWDSFGPKFHRRGDLRMGKFGLKIFPDSDIRDDIERHRDSLRT